MSAVFPTIRRLLAAFVAAAVACLFVTGNAPAAASGEQKDVPTIESINEDCVFADMHAHPHQFHRANVSTICGEEIARYRRGLMDVVVCCVSSDAAYHGGYVKKDSTTVERLRPGDYYTLQAGDAYAFTLERVEIIRNTMQDTAVVLGLSPETVLEAKMNGQLSMVIGLEGADGLEGSLDNLRELHRLGLRVLQLVHFRANELGHTQTRPYKPGGLTSFGEKVVRECNRLGIIIDLAHAHKQTTMDVLAVSTRPVISSHTGVKALRNGDRYLSDDEIRAIAKNGGVVGIWPIASFPTMDDMVRHIDYIKNLVGIDHVGIGSDLRGMRATPEFGEDANFRAIADALLARGYSAEETGKVMGGNFFRLWTDVARDIEP